MKTENTETKPNTEPASGRMLRLVRPLTDAESLAGKLLAFIKVNHQRGTFKDLTDYQLDEALKPFEEDLRTLKANNQRCHGEAVDIRES